MRGLSPLCGRRRPADYPVLRLCWAILLRYLLGWSLRTLEHEMRVSLLVRWCTHFALQEETPDHTTLARFETWVREHALDVTFVTVLEQIDADFPDDARELQCGDTFGEGGGCLAEHPSAPPSTTMSHWW